MPFFVLHRVRNCINWVISPLGFAIERTRKTKWVLPNSITETKIGNYLIQVPGLNLTFQYETKPGYGSQLGRLTSVVRQKHPKLGVVDIGANVGDTACIIKSAEDVPVLCIEGDEKSFAFLQKNIRQFHNVTAHKNFLAEQTGVINGHVECAGWNATLLPGTAESTGTIHVTRFDEFITTQTDWKKYKLLKVDAEGFDCAILRGSMQFIKSVSPVIFFEYNRRSMRLIGERGLETLFMLGEMGYSQMGLHDAGGTFIGSVSLQDRERIRDWHDYVDGPSSEIFYLDLAVFHEADTDIAKKFFEMERAYRAGAASPSVSCGKQADLTTQ